MLDVMSTSRNRGHEENHERGRNFTAAVVAVAAAIIVVVVIDVSGSGE